MLQIFSVVTKLPKGVLSLVSVADDDNPKRPLIRH
jgi:hypothetical protein